VAVPVAMVTVDVPDPPGIVGGAKLQLAPTGKPPQESVAAALKPFSGANVTVVVAVEPARTGSGEGCTAEIEKSGATGPLTLIRVMSPRSLGGLFTKSKRSRRPSPVTSLI
jgi:hypothetical protein